jgi:DNA helicase II / ATP-dependent DNA helicase PcrA
MDKTITLAVAGSGKTSFIISELTLDRRYLIITYTINNTRNLKEEIIKKFGFMPKNINLFSYYPFLYTFCFRPFLAYKAKPRGIYWETPPHWTNKLKRNDIKYYMTTDRKLYHNRIARLLQECKVLEEINQRLEKYYDCLYVDEVQDFAGHDFNLLKCIAKSNLKICFVGDFFQHTFDTSRDGNTNANLHEDYSKYQEILEKSGLQVDSEHLNKSFRCSPTICKFITDKIGIPIESHRSTETAIKFIEDDKESDEIFANNKIIKLFYKENYKYNCYSRNWGDCKGENCYYDVCVVLNKTTLEYFKNNNLSDLKPVTKNKLYVACSRARGNLYFVADELLKKYKNK